MRICICGLHREGAVKKAEEILGIESVNIDYPGMKEDNEYQLFYYAAETFKHFNKTDVIFDGGVFDSTKHYSDSGWVDLQEQVILSAIDNLDNIVIVTKDMDEKNINFCKSYAELYPNKFLFIDNENELVIK